MSDPIVGYMCKTDFDYELGYAADGSKVYPDIESLRAFCRCVSDCGIVEVTVTLSKVIQPANL
jgi:hypothetical protein